ncbi:MAG: YtxH domain-containing protein [Gemmatimonadaceae bacterium]|nr:YtxH domain-containing protein [Gemmatimonadaceae bacterium]
MFSSDDAVTTRVEKNKGKAVGTAYETVPDWPQIGTFVAGLGIGAAVGAAVALLWAPGSGEDTRGRIRRKFSRAGDESLWESLGQELKRAAAKRHPIDEEEIEELEDVEVLDENAD